MLWVVELPVLPVYLRAQHALGVSLRRSFDSFESGYGGYYPHNRLGVSAEIPKALLNSYQNGHRDGNKVLSM
jgi:hypothetical protein